LVVPELSSLAAQSPQSQLLFCLLSCCPQARLIVGTPRIWTDFGAILRVNNLAPNFQKTITVSLNNVAYQLISW
jgi:hypothetical protein